ncbi:response regulator [Candidatus Saccharibacteria bacterium]|nr:response regulator [Candidatus Saccharibacteria bacterium]
MIYVIDSDEIMAECVARACAECGKKTRIFDNAIEALGEMSKELPEMILMEIMLTGPDGWTLLNELISYDDTAKIPVVIVSEDDYEGMNLDVYGVVGVLRKDTMKPSDVRRYVLKYTGVKAKISA